jgi:hypothetical protein
MAITVNTDLQLLEADRNFLDLVQNRITIYGQIPYQIPTKLIIDITKESARYFFKNYWRSTEKTYYHILKEDILKTLNMSDLTSGIMEFTIKLPSYVNIVKEIYEANDSNAPPTSQELIENVQLVSKSSSYGNSVLGINNSLYILEAACRMIESQNWKSIFGTSIPFHYNSLTNYLNIRKSPEKNYLLECEVNVDIQYLYRDDLFIRHVIGRTKQELKRLIASHTIELPGGATLNAEEICNNTEDVEKVEELIKGGSGIGDIILMR